MSEVKALDHGYVKLVETWGSDERVIESARMSTNKGFKGWGPIECPCCHSVGTCEYPGGEWGPCSDCGGQGFKAGDEKLLAYLYSHKHMTPFEMGGMIIEVQAPIMVFREWHRHRTQSYNELSARYTELPNLFYIPSIERLMAAKQSGKNKQGSEEGFTENQARYIQEDIQAACNFSRKIYEDLLQSGVSREIARLVIPVNQYSRMRASANLRNWLAFLTLRMDSGAQWEIRQYANIVAGMVKEAFPRTYSLFEGGNND